MDHLYIRLAWAYLEPKEGQFDWAVIDRIIEKWTAHGLGIAFRISCKETSTALTCGGASAGMPLASPAARSNNNG